MGSLLRFRKDKETKSADPLERLVLKERLRVMRKTGKAVGEPVITGVRRGNDRTRTHKVGEILLDNGKTLSCIVSDFSDTGMKIQITEEGEAPDRFRLRVPTLEFDRTVEVAWREAPLLGVAYTG